MPAPATGLSYNDAITELQGFLDQNLSADALKGELTRIIEEKQGVVGMGIEDSLFCYFQRTTGWIIRKF